jgi:hypothetical protein
VSERERERECIIYFCGISEFKYTHRKLKLLKEKESDESYVACGTKEYYIESINI